MARNLGFDDDGQKLDVSQFSPRSKPDPEHDAEMGDATAERLGFASREAPERVSRMKKPSKPYDQAFVRAPLEVINRFKTFCNETGLNYGEALEELMRRAKV